MSPEKSKSYEKKKIDLKKWSMEKIIKALRNGKEKKL